MSHTLILIIVTAAISFLAFNNHKLYNDLIMYPPAIRKGQYYRFLTAGFIHADLMHLAFNMITLWFFGNALEGYMNKFFPYAFVIFYLVAITLSDIPSYLKNKDNSRYASLGASGGVAAILFAFIVLAPWQTIFLFFIPVPAIVFGVAYMIYSQYMSRKGGDNINHDAHFWGAVIGVVGILILDPNAGGRFLQEIVNPRFNLGF